MGAIRRKWSEVTKSADASASLVETEMPSEMAASLPEGVTDFASAAAARAAGVPTATQAAPDLLVERGVRRNLPTAIFSRRGPPRSAGQLAARTDPSAEARDRSRKSNQERSFGSSGSSPESWSQRLNGARRLTQPDVRLIPDSAPDQ